MLEDLGQRRLIDQVADRLRDKIYAGEYLPGDRLRQERLAGELSVSRTPLREALRMLERDGLLAVSPSRGVQVVSAEPAHLLSAYEVREVVDGLATRLAARSRASDLAAQLRRHLECQEAAIQPWNARLWTRMNVSFHCTILEYAGNPVLLPQAALIRLTAQVFYPYQRLDPQRAGGALEEHRRIVAAISDGDGDAAEALARAHVRCTLETLREIGRDGGKGAGTARPSIDRRVPRRRY